MKSPSYERSFASHEKAKYWSEKNGDIKPKDVFMQSNKKYWFDCDTCNHSFDMVVYSISAGKWCPYCANQKLCKKQDCTACYNKTFASHEKAKYWSEQNGDIKPKDVFMKSHTKCWFDCDTCNHSFDTALFHISAGKWCPYCTNHKLCKKPDCTACYNKSFASHEKAKYWSEQNGDIKPKDVFKSSGNKCWFDCDKCNHSFDTALNNISAGKWCPYCKNKTEQKLYDTLKPLYPMLITQFKQEWCKKSRCLPFDFCIPEHNIIIELDGSQHFIQVSNWTSPEETFENDSFKEKCANDNGYSVIRILQEDVFGDKYDWLSKLQTEIENIIKDDTTTIIHNIYMCENSEYDKFMLL